MNCPHCAGKLSLFSKALNRFERVKRCPQCGGKFRLKLEWKRALLWFGPALFLEFALRWVFGFSFGFVGGLLILFMSTRLEAVETPPVP